MKDFEDTRVVAFRPRLRRALRRHCGLARILAEQLRRGLRVRDDAAIHELDQADETADRLSPLDPADARYLAETRSFVLEVFEGRPSPPAPTPSRRR